MLLVSVAGEDKPGLMAMLTSALIDFQAQVLDLGQAIIHDELALGLLVEVEKADQVPGLKQKIQQIADRVGSNLRFETVTRDDYLRWVAESSHHTHILTLLAVGRVTEQLAKVSEITRAHGFNIDTVRRLSDPINLDSDRSKWRVCMELRIRGEQDVHVLGSDLMAAAATLNFDFSVHEDNVYRRNRRLVAFDMDSTLIAAEVIDELAARHGVGDQVAAITAKAMQGELDFKASFRKRAALLKGLDAKVLDEVARSVKLNPGADRLIRTLKHFGYRTAILSGGFQYVGEVLKKQFGIDYVFANQLEVVDGVMTGAVKGEIVDAARKAELLHLLAERDGIALRQTIAIGDGANDLPMLNAAGLGVAYHAKQAVRETAKVAIQNFGLDSVLYLIGFTDADIELALAGSGKADSKER